MKIALINWLAIYPIVTLVLFILEPWLEPYSLPVKTLILTIIIVPLMVFIVVPLLSAIFKRIKQWA